MVLIKCVVISWVLKDLFSFIGNLLIEFEFKNKVANLTKYLIGYLLTCTKCATFWFTLIYTGDLFISAITALVCDFLCQLEYKYKKTTL